MQNHSFLFIINSCSYEVIHLWISEMNQRVNEKFLSSFFVTQRTLSSRLKVYINPNWVSWLDLPHFVRKCKKYGSATSTIHSEFYYNLLLILLNLLYRVLDLLGKKRQHKLRWRIFSYYRSKQYK